MRFSQQWKGHCMTIRMLWAPAALSLLVLSGCSSTPASPQVNQLHREVSQLNQQMRQLTNQASALEIQGQLNSQSSQGAWLLPQANTPVELQTQLGKLRLSLTRVVAEAGGSHTTLNIRSTDGKPVPALNAIVVWGELDPATGKPLNAESLNQNVSVPASLTPQNSVTIPLSLSGLTPEQLGYVRVHDVTSATTP
jgi:outer membrane murein-binding lipoprotein Lpp